MKNLDLQRHQLDKIFYQMKRITGLAVPKTGWIRAIRSALGMPLAIAAKKFGMTPEGVLMLEKRESEGTITLKALREAASALECTLFYAVVPNTDLESIIEREASRLASTMAERASATMSLEGQATTSEASEEARRSLVQKLKTNPKLIWKAQP